MERDSLSPLPVQTMLGDRYRLEKVLASGGFGTVYEAVQVDLGRRVAVKVLSREASLARDAITRFEREAKATGSLGHTHIVQVTDFNAGPPAFLVMELLAGQSLAAALSNDARLPVARAVRIALQVLSGLGAAHALGIVHRDIKPANLFLVATATGDDLVKVLDFGIAKAVVEGTAQTETGVVLGTVKYMAPEQAMGAPIDARVDVYAVGAVLYRMLSGACVVEARSVAELLHQIARGPIPLEQRVPDLPGAIADVVARALKPDPADRFESAAAMAVALAKAADITAPAWAQQAKKSDERSTSTTAPTRLEGTFEPHAQPTAATKSGAVMGGMIGVGLLGAAVIVAAAMIYIANKAPSGTQPTASEPTVAPPPSVVSSDAPMPHASGAPSTSVVFTLDAAPPAIHASTFIDMRGAEYTPIPVVTDLAGRSWWAIGPMWIWPTPTPPPIKAFHASQVDTCDSTCPELVAADAALKKCVPLARPLACMRVRAFYYSLRWSGGQLRRLMEECESVDESHPARPRMTMGLPPPEPQLDACLVAALTPMVQKYLSRPSDDPTNVFVQLDR